MNLGYPLIAALALAASVRAQNLVPNWSFEEHTACPDAYSQLERATEWHNASNNNTYQGFRTDYMHACGTPQFQVPSSDWGFQEASTGSAYVTLCTMNTVYQPNYRENIYVQLVEPLVIGQQYWASIQISKADNSKLASNNLGLKFSTVTDFPINGICQVNNPIMMLDVDNWALIGGSFVADSAYAFVCVGNFFPDSETDLQLFCPDCPFNHYGYFIDDVCVTPWDPETGQGLCSQLYSPQSVSETSGSSKQQLLTYVSGDELAVVGNATTYSGASLRIIGIDGSTQRAYGAITDLAHIPLLGLADGIYLLEMQLGVRTITARFVVAR